MAQQLIVVVNNLTTETNTGTVTIGSFKMPYSVAGGTNWNGGIQMKTSVGSNIGGSTSVSVNITNGIHTGTATGSVDVNSSGTNTYLCLSVTQNGYVNMFTCKNQVAASVG